MPVRRLIAALLPLTFAVTTCIAQLNWVTTEVLLDLNSSQEGGSAVFEFVNEGRLPVRIAKVDPGCGCTVPTLSKTEFAPGGKGSLSAHFTAGERRGVYRVPIRVDFEDGQSDGLTLIAQIRELVKVFPLNLAWAPGEKRAPKDVEFHWTASEQVEIVNVRCTGTTFTAALVPNPEWSGGLLRLTPVGETATGVAVVIVTTVQGPDRRGRSYTLVARAL